MFKTQQTHANVDNWQKKILLLFVLKIAQLL